MSAQSFDFQDLLQLVELMKSTTQFSEFRLRANGIELELRRGSGGPSASSGGVALDGAGATGVSASNDASVSNGASASNGARSSHVSAASAGAASSSTAPGARAAVQDAIVPAAPSAPRQEPHPRGSPPPAARVAAEGQIIVKAPMVGTVYLAPEPGAQPFVKIGQTVDSGTQVCIVEVMKLMNAIPAGGAGTVTEILVGDAEPVEYGQPLFVITP